MATKSKKPIKKSQKQPAGLSKSPTKSTITRSARRKLTRKQKISIARKEQNYKKLPAAWKILVGAVKHLYENKKLFLGILVVFAVLNSLFVTGVSGNFPLQAIRAELADSSVNTSGISGGFELFSQLLGSAGQASSDAGGVYQTVFLIVASLALIWALRKTYHKKSKLRIRDSFYGGMGQLVPFTLILLVILLQLIPLVIGGSIFSIVQSNGIADSGVMQFMWGLVFALGLLTSLYWVSSSIIALYIVTLPGTAPMRALRQAKKIVRFRRGAVILKIAFLPVILTVSALVILLPLIIFVSPAAEVMFLAYNIVLLGVVHSYMYNLYRELL